MAQFALIRDGAFVEIRTYPSKPDDIAHKNVVWLPVVRETVDTSQTEYKKNATESIVQQDSYLIRTTISDMTQQEVDAVVNAEQTAALAKLDVTNSLLKALGVVMFELVNDVRTLKGQQPITAQQFRNYVKGKL